MSAFVTFPSWPFRKNVSILSPTNSVRERLFAPTSLPTVYNFQNLIPAIGYKNKYEENVVSGSEKVNIFFCLVQ